MFSNKLRAAFFVLAGTACVLSFADSNTGAGSSQSTGHRVIVPRPAQWGALDSTYIATNTAGGPDIGNSSGSGAGSGGSNNTQVVTENDGAVAAYTAPGDAVSTTITMHNDAPPIWEGELQAANGQIVFGLYDRFVTISDSSGNPVQTVEFGRTIGPYGGHEDACYNGYAECDRGIGSYLVSPSTVRGANSTNVPPDGVVGDANYVYPQTDPNQTAVLTLYNIPALFKLSIGTRFGICMSGQTMPAPGTGSWVSASVPACSVSDSAQGGATDGFGGDTRYIAPFQVVNRSSWHTDYTVSAALSASGNSPANCPAQTFTGGVLTNGHTCSDSVAASPVGTVVDEDGGGRASYTQSGEMFTQQCHLHATCAVDFTNPSNAGTWSGGMSIHTTSCNLQTNC